jgi:hypothetical protein
MVVGVLRQKYHCRRCSAHSFNRMARRRQRHQCTYCFSPVLTSIIVSCAHARTLSFLVDGGVEKKMPWIPIFQHRCFTQIRGGNKQNFASRHAACGKRDSQGSRYRGLWVSGRSSAPCDAFTRTTHTVSRKGVVAISTVCYKLEAWLADCISRVGSPGERFLRDSRWGSFI